MARSDHGYKTLSSSQLLLRFVSTLYIAWFAISIAGSFVLCVLYYFGSFDITSISSSRGTSSPAFVANGVLFIIDSILTIAVALFTRSCSEHPSRTSRYRSFIWLLVALDVLGAVQDIFTGNLVGVTSDLYSLVILGFLLYLSKRVASEYAAGRAVDASSLARTPSGRILYSERSVWKAIAAGDIPNLNECRRGVKALDQ